MSGANRESVLKQTLSRKRDADLRPEPGVRSWIDIPVRRREEVILVPVNQVASIVAEGELLHISTVRGDQHTITYCLKDLEARLDPSRFLRLGRGTLANIDCITKVQMMPGGTPMAILNTSH